MHTCFINNSGNFLVQQSKQFVNTSFQKSRQFQNYQQICKRITLQNLITVVNYKKILFSAKANKPSIRI